MSLRADLYSSKLCDVWVCGDKHTAFHTFHTKTLLTQPSPPCFTPPPPPPHLTSSIITYSSPPLHPVHHPVLHLFYSKSSLKHKLSVLCTRTVIAMFMSWSSVHIFTLNMLIYFLTRVSEAFPYPDWVPVGNTHQWTHSEQWARLFRSIPLHFDVNLWKLQFDKVALFLSVPLPCLSDELVSALSDLWLNKKDSGSVLTWSTKLTAQFSLSSFSSHQPDGRHKVSHLS